MSTKGMRLFAAGVAAVASGVATGGTGAEALLHRRKPVEPELSICSYLQNHG